MAVGSVRGRTHTMLAPILQDLQGNEEIDLESKADLIRQATEDTIRGDANDPNVRAISLSKAAEVNKQFAAAKLGTDPLYKTRRLFQNRRQSILAQPGRSQTVLTRQ
jgi:hypothetical protein